MKIQKRQTWGRNMREGERKAKRAEMKMKLLFYSFDFVIVRARQLTKYAKNEEEVAVVWNFAQHRLCSVRIHVQRLVLWSARKESRLSLSQNSLKTVKKAINLARHTLSHQHSRNGDLRLLLSLNFKFFLFCRRRCLWTVTKFFAVRGIIYLSQSKLIKHAKFVRAITVARSAA